MTKYSLYDNYTNNVDDNNYRFSRVRMHIQKSCATFVYARWHNKNCRTRKERYAHLLENMCTRKKRKKYIYM